MGYHALYYFWGVMGRVGCGALISLFLDFTAPYYQHKMASIGNIQAQPPQQDSSGHLDRPRRIATSKLVT